MTEGLLRGDQEERRVWQGEVGLRVGCGKPTQGEGGRKVPHAGQKSVTYGGGDGRLSGANWGCTKSDTTDQNKMNGGGKAGGQDQRGSRPMGSTSLARWEKRRDSNGDRKKFLEKKFTPGLSSKTQLPAVEARECPSVSKT